jgi:transglycosylase-like protein
MRRPLAIAVGAGAIAAHATAAVAQSDDNQPNNALAHEVKERGLLAAAFLEQHERPGLLRPPRREMRVAARRLRLAARRRARRRAESATKAVPQLEAIAACESHGDPHAIGGGGSFRGKYQMTYSTWASVGGSGDPAAAPESEQDQRAALLYQRSGPGQWPVCGA